MYRSTLITCSDLPWSPYLEKVVHSNTIVESHPFPPATTRHLAAFLGHGFNFHWHNQLGRSFLPSARVGRPGELWELFC